MFNNYNNRGNTNQKPELLLKRANDIVNLGTGTGEKEKRTALDLLHSAISTQKGKKTQWNKNFETLMLRHVQLSVDLKDHATAKDGLHQYRNLCMSADPQSLELVVNSLIDLGERKLSDAKRRSNQASIAANARLADLEQDESPESIVLSAMTEDGANDRTNREMVVPWLKFVWEVYRAAVELLSRITKLDKVYHIVSRRAFQFCQDNNRRTEFRRLCEMLRSQLENTQKPAQVSGILKTPKPQFEWTTEVVELYMQTKFEQLDKATSMDLWNEAFRTIEDISKILSKKSAKTKSLVTYYEKLTKIFWVADNKLFHAYALLKLYALSAVKNEEKQYLASAVLLAAMSVPPTATIASASASTSLGLTDERDADDYQVDRNADLAVLLDFHSVNPTRQSLIQEINQRQIAAESFPELADLFTSMEVEFSPIKLSKKIAPAINVLRQNAQTAAAQSVSLQQYAAPLERNVVVRYMQQLSKAYSQVKIDYVLKALSGLTVLSRMQIERVLVDAVRARHLSLRVSHVEGSITFVNSTSSVQAVDSQVFHLGQVLSRAQETVRTVINSDADEKKKLIESRKAYFKTVETAYDDLYFDLLERSRVIEQRKEDYETQLLRKEEEQRNRDEEEKRRKEEQVQREEIRKRREEEDEKRRKEQEEQEIIFTYAELKRLGNARDLTELRSWTVEKRKATLKEAEEAYRKGKEEEKKRLELQAKQFDYRVRAERLESFANVDRRVVVYSEQDKQLHEKATASMHTRWQEEHAKQLVEKARLAKLNPYRSAFEQTFREQQVAAYQRLREQELQRQLKRVRDMNLVAARKLAAEEKERLQEEARSRAAEEEERRLELMRAEVLRAERQAEEQRQRDEEERMERMRREATEAEERQRRQREEAAANTPPPAAPSKYQPPVRGAPPANNDEGGGWRRPGGDRGFGSGNGGRRGGDDRDTEASECVDSVTATDLVVSVDSVTATDLVVSVDSVTVMDLVTVRDLVVDSVTATDLVASVDSVTATDLVVSVDSVTATDLAMDLVVSVDSVTATLLVVMIVPAVVTVTDRPARKALGDKRRLRPLPAFSRIQPCYTLAANQQPRTF
eukprot:gene8642-6221_t